MTRETSTTRWQRRIDIAESTVRGDQETLEPLQEEVRLLGDDEHLLDTPAAAHHMSYFLALLRELGTVARTDYASTVRVISRWVQEELVPQPHQCVVHTRMAAVLADGGDDQEARQALVAAHGAARTELEQAYTLSQRGVLETRLGNLAEALRCAEQAAQLSQEAGSENAWLDVRMRTTLVFFHMEYLAAHRDRKRVEALAQQLVDICGRQIDRWGSDHPRALEALVVLASAQHALAEMRGDLMAMDQLTDVLASAAQRSASSLGARHPLTTMARATLTGVHHTTSRLRAQEYPSSEVVVEQSPASSTEESMSINRGADPVFIPPRAMAAHRGRVATLSRLHGREALFDVHPAGLATRLWACAPTSAAVIGSSTRPSRRSSCSRGAVGWARVRSLTSCGTPTRHTHRSH
ncbi:hypothetical protein [Streptomyces sp. NPDC056660]|uniref:hypothetical protein n=1 Tax=Streptomyces sp. NPDC056660 TaxID=3345897 RepID=UPI003680EE4B